MADEKSSAALLHVDILLRIFGILGSRSLGRCGSVSANWRAAASSNDCWEHALLDIGRSPYRTAITAAGARAWKSSVMGGDVPIRRGHLRRLQETRELRDLFRFVHCFHNGVEAETLSARAVRAWYNAEGIKAAVSLELLNFWSHDSWVLLRPKPHYDDVDAADVDHNLSTSGRLEDHLDLSGVEAQLRCWEACCPPGALGPQHCHMLDCSLRGQLFRLPALSTLEIGSHKYSSRAKDGKLILECTMGRWPDDGLVCPLPPTAANAFLHDSADGLYIPDEDDDKPSGFEDISEEWFAGSRLPEPCSLGPVLYRSYVELDVSSFV
eukprot:TRINITY_DN121334_c0_g1_i1.p1 TRINITY_DN121334_c0_g1~~TRINITY_DN121334_c0_g1_i1.p1  ORF type:complete len:340 (-),score=49.67 TRINITY_DN121334_c0_g1_i1:547-1518(-)